MPRARECPNCGWLWGLGKRGSRCSLFVKSNSFCTFVGLNANKISMLGIDKNNTPIIQEEFAEEMREAVRRKYSDQPSSSDVQISIRSKQIKSEYNVVWK